jgi:hypothetical protein
MKFIRTDKCYGHYEAYIGNSRTYIRCSIYFKNHKHSGLYSGCICPVWIVVDGHVLENRLHNIKDNPSKCMKILQKKRKKFIRRLNKLAERYYA